MLEESPHQATAALRTRGKHRPLAVDWTGIKGMRLPIRVADRSGDQASVARFDLCAGPAADLPEELTSGLVKILDRHERRISVRSFPGLLSSIASMCGPPRVRLEIAFPFFIDKKAPVSGAHSLLDYEGGFIGEADAHGARTSVRVLVPVTSLCPCSKAISRYGAHNQRSLISVTAHTREPVWLEELVALVEAEASCELYGLLKRADEKYVTEKAYDQPKFVEDLVRDVALRLNRDDRIDAYTVEAENFESIHDHSAYALIRRGPRDA